ncbi:MAG: hypothetical protein AAB116_04975, partial [Candidatus Poribacteria bacterium]
MKIIFFLIFCLLFANQLFAQVIDEFNNPNLDPKLWEMKKAGKASYEIKNGVLTMSSPSVESGIML